MYLQTQEFEPGTGSWLGMAAFVGGAFLLWKLFGENGEATKASPRNWQPQHFRRD